MTSSNQVAPGELASAGASRDFYCRRGAIATSAVFGLVFLIGGLLASARGPDSGFAPYWFAAAVVEGAEFYLRLRVPYVSVDDERIVVTRWSFLRKSIPWSAVRGVTNDSWRGADIVFGGGQTVHVNLQPIREAERQPLVDLIKSRQTPVPG